MYLEGGRAASVEEGLPTAVEVDDDTEEIESVRERLGMVGLRCEWID